MSTSDSRAIEESDEGFTLVEILVSIGLLSVVMVASLPVFIAMLASTATTRLNTQGKNHTQERLEQVRDLRFHVDRQNGPFLDLLDLYYTNAKGAGPTTSVTASGATLSGRYVATGAATNGLPAAPFYQTSTGPLVGAPGFSQVVATQFLGPTGTVLPAVRYQDLYDSQVVGKDSPPSLVLGVTVITSWMQAGKSKTYRTYTQVTEGRPELPVIQSQARAVSVDVTSSGADGATLELQTGVASVDGAQSSGSSASAFVAGALAARTGVANVTGRVGQFSLPASGVAASGDPSRQDPGLCSWYAFGPTDTTNVTGDVSGGLPKAPTNVGTTSPFNRVSGFVSASGGNHSCGLLSYDNLTGGGVALPSGNVAGTNMGTAPYVKVSDSPGVSGAALSGSGYVTANDIGSTPQQTRAGASTTMTRSITLFPNHPFSLGSGLVSAKLSTASVDCTSGTATVAGTITGAYSLELMWWGKGLADAGPRWHTANWTYDSADGTPLVRTGDLWAPTTTVLGNGATLSQLVQISVPSATEGVVTTGATTGLRGFPTGVLTMTTAPTLTNEAAPGFSAIKVQLGQLTCVADDQR